MPEDGPDAAMRAHLDDHSAGVLTGHVPQSYLDLLPCCGLSVSKLDLTSLTSLRPSSLS